MIEKMKKLTFLVTSKEYESFLQEIRELGVVHIAELQNGGTSPELQEALAYSERCRQALNTLKSASDNYTTDKTFGPSKADASKADSIMDEIERLTARESDLKRSLDSTKRTISTLEPWGNFTKDNFGKLEKAGYKAFFYSCPVKMFDQEWSDKYFATQIAVSNDRCLFIAFSAEKPEISAEAVDMPEESLNFYIKKKADIEAQIESIHERLLQINAEDRDSILAAQVDNENSLSLSKVHLNTESLAEDRIKMMVGWVEAENEKTVCECLDKNQIFYEVEDPDFEDDIPVKIKNGAFSSLFEPILRMYSLPSYHDIDPTPFFAPFFMLFFGLCMGDAGYGFVILAASLILRMKLADDMKPYASLGICLGAMTIVCGTLTGSLFGIDMSSQDWAFLAPVKQYFISENNFKLFGYSPMMVISVVIGLIQVLLGMCLSAAKAIKLYGWKYGVGKISWVAAIVSAIVYLGVPACGGTLPMAVNYLLYAIIGISALGIYFFNTPGKNIFMNFGSGIWNTYNMATGLLGDLLSYIRLFALGLTGGVLGGVFNQLAIEMTSSLSWGIRWLPMLLILLAGHGINFALCMISSFVHPMRLTFVEFFKNAEFDGGGKEFEPFRVKTFKNKK